MIIKTLQWNIGGGKIRNPNSPAEGPYDIDGIAYIVDLLKTHNPDIITLQETHADNRIVQSKSIAENIGLSYLINDIYDKSHIEDGQGLGQAIISRFPIGKHNFKFFFNPHFEIAGPDGGKWISHDKGVSKCFLQLSEEIQVEVATLHLIPFRKFEVDPLEEEFSYLRDNISELCSPSSNNFLLQGDFNFDDSSLKTFLPSVFKQDVSEVLLEDPTTPKGRKYDHVVYRGLKHISSEVVSDVLTDHFPIISKFEL